MPSAGVIGVPDENLPLILLLRRTVGTGRSVRALLTVDLGWTGPMGLRPRPRKREMAITPPWAVCVGWAVDVDCVHASPQELAQARRCVCFIVDRVCLYQLDSN